MNKVMVTGGAGFIGSYIVDMLVERGDSQVFIYDNLDPQVHPGGDKPGYLNQDAVFIKGDIRDRDTLAKAAADMDRIYHLAAAVGVGQSMYQVGKYVEVNTLGAANLLEILVNGKSRVEKLLVAASMSSYGEGRYNCPVHGLVSPSLRNEADMAAGDWELHCPECGSAMKPVPTDEEKPLFCNSIYALTKKDQEEMSLMIGRTYSIPTVALRFFNTYGPRQSLSNPYTGVCAIFMSRIKNGNSPVIYEDGLQSRDFISVKDIARACVAAMEDPRADYQIFNVGTGIPTTIRRVAETLTEIYGVDIIPRVINSFRKGDIRHCYADCSKIERLLGFRPEVSFKDGMRELAEWTEKVFADDKFDRASSELAERGLVVGGKSG